MRRTYCAELFEDASLVGLYRSARPPYCAISLAVACCIQTVCLQVLGRQSAGSSPGSCLTRNKRGGTGAVLLLLVDVGCLLQRADWRRRSIVTIHPHDAVLSRRVRKTFVMKMAKTDPCSCNAWRTCGTKSIASTERCSQSDRYARQSHPSVSVAFALLWTTWPSVTATQQSRIALKAIRFQKADQTRN